MKRYIVIVLVSISLSVFIMGQFNNPLDPIDREILKKEISNILPDLVFDIAWNSFFHYSTIFEGFATSAPLVDSAGYTIDVSGEGGLDTKASVGAIASVTPNGIVLSTGTTNNNLAQIYRYPEPTLGTSTVMPFLSWKNKSKFRTNFAVSSVANQTMYLVAGLDPTSNSLPFYGFKIVNGNLYGVCRKDASAETIILLQAISANTSYLVEARHDPVFKKVDFFVEVSGTMISRGSITNSGTIPDASNTNHNGLFFYSAQTNTTADKILTSSYFEYIQKRDN